MIFFHSTAPLLAYSQVDLYFTGYLFAISKTFFICHICGFIAQFARSKGGSVIKTIYKKAFEF
ncbi:MAG: hypothetical protein CMF70_09930 [Magnetovibrio sp.]|nr:hypothetical protein [Magnetovibrio sp.]